MESILSYIPNPLNLFLYIRLFLRKRSIYRSLARYKWEKENAYRISVGHPPRKTWFQTLIYWLIVGPVGLVLSAFTPSGIKLFVSRGLSIRTSPERVVLSMAGWFLFGLTFAWSVYWIAAHVVGARRVTLLLIVVLVGTLVPYYVTSSLEIRGFILILIPMLAGRQVRAFLVIYILAVASDGPLENFRRNTLELGHSATCTAQVAKQILRELSQNIQEIARALYQAFQEFIAPIKERIRDVGRVIKTTKNFIVDNVNYLRENVYICDKINDSAEMSDKCAEKLIAETILRYIPDMLSNLVASGTCGSLVFVYKAANEATTRFCAHVNETARRAYAEAKVEVLEAYHTALERIQEELDIRVEMNFTNYNSIRQHNWEEIWERIEADLPRLNFLGFLTRNLYIPTASFTLLCVTFGAIYLIKYMALVGHDNVYITGKIRHLDTEQRLQRAENILLPLTLNERSTYVTSLSVRMSRAELSSLAVSLLFVIFAGGFALIAMGLDWLTWYTMTAVLGLVHDLTPIGPGYKLHMNVTTKSKETWMRISEKYTGNGPLNTIAGLTARPAFPMDRIERAFRNITSISFEPFRKCLPDPSEPLWDEFRQLSYLLGFLLFTALFAAYILRLRQMFAGLVFPTQHAKRALWLYNHILQLRSPAVASLRRKRTELLKIPAAHDGAKSDDTADEVYEDYDDERAGLRRISFWTRLIASSRILSFLVHQVLGMRQFYCFKCGSPIIIQDLSSHVQCEQANCRSLYHRKCAENLSNVCMICLKTIETIVDTGPEQGGRKADFEEFDSSDEEEENDDADQ